MLQQILRAAICTFLAQRHARQNHDTFCFPSVLLTLLNAHGTWLFCKCCLVHLLQVLPDSLADSISGAAECTSLAILRSNSRTQVELLLPEFWDPISGPIFPNRGDQEKFWKMTRRFVEELAQKTGLANVKVVYPDAGERCRMLTFLPFPVYINSQFKFNAMDTSEGI